MSTKATWSDVLTWSKGEIEKARAALETETDPAAAADLRSRVKVMRELQTINEIPKAPDHPDPVEYA